MTRSAPRTPDPFGMPFLVCDENRFAHAAINELIETTAERGRLVALHGPAGTGKSHLTHLLLRELSRRGPITPFKFTPSEIRVEAAESLPDISWPEHPARRGESPPRRLLICEDLQLAARLSSVQQTIVAWLDECRSSGIDCVVTMTRTPGDITGLSQRLRNRLRAATCAGLLLPGTASRDELLKHFCVHAQIPLAPHVTKLLAKKLMLSPRELQGALRRFDDFSRLRRVPLDAQAAMAFIKTEVLPRTLTIEEIARVVAREFGVKLADIRSDARDTTLKTARQCAMFLARELTAGQYARIGEYFSNRSHSTVMHACERIATLLPEDPALRQRIANVKQSLGSVSSTSE